MTLGELGAFLFDQPLLALTIGAILLGVSGGMLASARPRLSHTLRGAAYLGLTVALLFTVAEQAGHNPRSEAALWLDQVRPAQIAGRETIVTKHADGHFWVQARLNGKPVDFLIDTGATYTGVSPEVARRTSLIMDENDAGVMLETANGPVVARMGQAGLVQFGGIEARALPVAVGPDIGIQTNVIGMNLLSRLSSWRVEGDRLILAPVSRR